MKNVTEVLNSKEMLSDDQIMALFYLIGQNGDIVLMKHDGMRADNTFTIVISSSENRFDAIRADANTLSDAMKDALKKYLNPKMNEPR